MRREKRFMFGFVVMFCLLLAGVVGTVSAAELDNNARLQLEVRLLEKVNALNLTNEQIGQILPVLRKVEGIIQTTQVEVEKLLTEEKELLLQRKAEEAKAIELKISVLRDKAELEVKQVLLDVKTILAPEQMHMIGQRMGMAGEHIGMLKIAPKPQMMGNQKQIIIGRTHQSMKGKPSEKDLNYLDKQDKVEVLEEDKMPAEVAQILMEKRKAKLEELEERLKSAKDGEKEAIEHQIQSTQKQIQQLEQKQTQIITGKNFAMKRFNEMRGNTQNPMMMHGSRMMMCGKGMMAVRGMGGHNFGRHAEMLTVLIKVLEEMQTVK